MKVNRCIYLFIIINSIFSYNNQDARMISFAGAYNTLSTGYKCVGINPANLTINDNMSINLLNLNFNGINNFMTLNRYDKMNGANLEDPNAEKYFDKEKILGYLNEEDISYFSTGSMPLPMLSFSVNNIAVVSKMNFYSSYNLSPDIFEIVLYGNEINRLYDLSMFQETMIIWETSFSKAFDLDPISLGFTIKYHHGLAYYNLSPTQDTLYFKTELSDINAEAEYLVRQNIKGNGFSLDLGITTKEVNGWKLGASIINIAGVVEWNKNTVLDKVFESTYTNYPLRENEHYYINLIIDDLNLDVLNSPDITMEDIFIVNSYDVIELYDNPNISGNMTEGVDYFESALDGSFFVPSDTMNNEYINTLKPKKIKTDLPTKLNIGFSKALKNSRIIAFDFITGFDESFMNQQKWRVGIGYEFGNSRFPFRIGTSYGGYDEKSIAMGMGFVFGGFNIDLGISYKGSLNYLNANGMDFGIDLFWMKF